MTQLDAWLRSLTRRKSRRVAAISRLSPGRVSFQAHFCQQAQSSPAIGWNHQFYVGLSLGLLTTWHLASLTAIVLQESSDCVYDPKTLKTKFLHWCLGSDLAKVRIVLQEKQYSAYFHYFFFYLCALSLIQGDLGYPSAYLSYYFNLSVGSFVKSFKYLLSPCLCASHQLELTFLYSVLPSESTSC